MLNREQEEVLRSKPVVSVLIKSSSASAPPSDLRVCALLIESRGRAWRKGRKMYTARRKIQKDKGLEPSQFEDSVAQAFFDLENGNQELKSDLKDLYINNAFQMDVAGNRKAVVIHVPYRLRKAFKKIHVMHVRELEKKFSGKMMRCRNLLPPRYPSPCCLLLLGLRFVHPGPSRTRLLRLPLLCQAAERVRHHDGRAHARPELLHHLPSSSPNQIW